MTRPLAIGDVIRDNDPRMFGRRLTVVDVVDFGDGVVRVHMLRSIGGVRSYARARIYTDGKPRRTGYTRIEP